MISFLIALATALLVSQLPLMRGADGIPSFSKFMTVFIPALFALGHFMPALIGMLAVISGHGSKVLLAWLKTKPFSSSETIQTILKRRDPNEGIEETR